MHKFSIDSESSCLLLEFENYKSITDLADALGRDVSVVSRHLKRISENLPVLEKIHGKWQLTPLGKKLNHWTRDAIISQKSLLKGQVDLKIVTTREFANRILIPQLPQIFNLEDYHINILTAEDGVEDFLLSGRADIGLDCGKPFDPGLSFRRLANEEMSIVASKTFIKRFKIHSTKDLASLPYIHYSRNNSNTLLKLTQDKLNKLMTCNDIASVRQTLLHHIGWSMLPTYTIHQEIQAGLLAHIPGHKIRDQRFGVWWPRSRHHLLPYVETLQQWLAKQQLD